MERKSKKAFIIDVIYALIMLTAVILTSFILFKYLFPFVIGTIIAFAVQRPADAICKKLKFKKGLAAAGLSLLIYLSFAAVLVFLVYKLVGFSVGVAENLPDLLKKLANVFGVLKQKFSTVFSIMPQEFSMFSTKFFDNTASLIFEKLGGTISGFAGSVAKKMPQFFISSIVTLVATCYLAKDYETLVKFIKNFLGELSSKRIVKIKNIFVGSILKMIKGYLILLVITFVELFVGFLVLRVEYPFVLAVLIAFVDLLPVIGTGTVLIPWAFVSALLGNLKFAVCLAVLYVIILSLRNFMEPKIIGKQIGINSLFTLLFMFAGYKIFGVLGLVLFPIILIVTIKYYKSEMSEGLSV